MPNSSGSNDAIKSGVVGVTQLQQMITLVQKGGKLAGWCVVGTGLGLSAGLISTMAGHPVQLSTFAMTGSLLGTGGYGIRLFQRIKDPAMNELQDRLGSVKRLFDAGDLDQDQYEELRKKAIDKAKAKIG